MTVRSPVPGWLREVPLAHRGLHDAQVPENSLAAFAAARDAGYGVELDVRLSRDRVPVVVHDATLRRVAGLDRRVGRLPAGQLTRVPLHGTAETVPTLADALALLADTPTMLELKSVRPGAGPLEAAVAAVLDDHPGPACIAGFNPATARWFRHHRPAVPRVLTSQPAADSPLPGPLARRLARLADLEPAAPAAVSYQLTGLDTPVVTRWREAGGPVLAWTVRSEGDLAYATRRADNVIFEQVRP